MDSRVEIRIASHADMLLVIYRRLGVQYLYTKIYLIANSALRPCAVAEAPALEKLTVDNTPYDENRTPFQQPQRFSLAF